MKDLLEFFDKFSEIVFISDIETHEVLYMNQKLKNWLRASGQKDAPGEKCYNILQGLDAPCPFCDDHIPTPEMVSSCIHKNAMRNKRFIISDTLIQYDNRQCRLEIAIDVQKHFAGGSFYHTQGERILNECMRQGFFSSDPEKALRKMLAYAGEAFACDNLYLFEFEEESAQITYEWHSDTLLPWEETPQTVPFSSIDWWLSFFQKKEMVTITDLREIQAEYPQMHDFLQSRGIARLTAAPIIIEGQTVGFLEMDNPDEQMFSLAVSLISMIGYFASSLLTRRGMLKHLRKLGFYDSLTGAFNRHALAEHTEGQPMESLGLIYCDVVGLKQVNDTLGHAAGDRLLQECYGFLQDALSSNQIYRIGGDEFVAVFQNCGQEELLEKVGELKESIEKEQYHISVGYAWSDCPPFKLSDLLARADNRMYQDKQKYYAGTAPAQPHQPEAHKSASEEAGFPQFLKKSAYDENLLFHSFTDKNTACYFFLGDMQKNVFYISDNMRNDLGFRSNEVPNFLQALEQRIATAQSREAFRKNLVAILRDKADIHDIRYQLKLVSGKNIWVHSYGIIKWNDDHTAPLFFSGRMTHQDDDFLVDPFTNFPREVAMVGEIGRMKAEQKPVVAIGFCLNNITEVNRTKGRLYGDRLVQRIATNLMENLSDKMFFYRLEGLRFVAILSASCKRSAEDCIQMISDIICTEYRRMKIAVLRPCSFALMRRDSFDFKAVDFVEQMVTLIKIAKSDTGHLFVEYSQENISKTQRMSDMLLTLNNNVADNMKNFRIVVQPMISTKDNTIIAGEVLLRWKYEGKDVPPDVFIPMMEKENIIQTVGEWVFEQVVSLHAYHATCFPNFSLSFNVSLKQIVDDSFSGFMERTLAKYHMDGSGLTVEMIESSIDEQPEKLNQFVSVCRKMKIKIALDDYGSGYSGLRMLLQYPSDIVKLDRSLLKEVMESNNKRNFISIIVYGCHRLGMKICAEGVETPEQDAMIRECGCDLIQGYYYFRPMELDALHAMLKEKGPRLTLFPPAPET